MTVENVCEWNEREKERKKRVCGVSNWQRFGDIR